MDFHQICFVVNNIEEAEERYSATLGLGPFRRLDLNIPEANVHGKKQAMKARLSFAQAGSVEMEFIEPGEGDNIYREFLDAHGEGVHHLCTRVTDIEAEVSAFAAKGISVLASGRTHRVAFAYMDTVPSLGVIVEFVQRF
jgi:catechol 2,3-dioxygenase-like lactoylglutathione lyase family enzyme